MLITWQDSYSVGVAAIDADHRLLISLINQLDEAKETGQTRDVVGSVLNVLIEYTETHFDREEGLMRRGAYPEHDPHREEHARLKTQLRALQTRYFHGEHATIDEALLFLQTWLVSHILGVDMRYRPWVAPLDIDPAEERLLLEGVAWDAGAHAHPR